MVSIEEKCDQDEPLHEYARRQERQALASRRYYRFVRRLVVAKRIYLSACIGYSVFDPTVAFILLPMVISLLPLVAVQYWLVRRWTRHRRAAAFYHRALERMKDCWIGSGDAGDRYADPDHLYTSDLDIFGRGSLFELLCTPVTAGGRDTLAAFLQRPADVATIRARQAAVRELATDMDWREALDATGAAVPGVSLADVQSAATAPRAIPGAGLRAVVMACGWCTLVSWCLLWHSGSWWWSPCLAGLAVEAAVYLLVRRRLRVVCERGYQIGRSLAAVTAFAALVDGPAWRSELLRDARTRLAGTAGSVPKPLLAPLGLLLQLPVAYFLAVQWVPAFERRLLARLARLPAAWESIGQCEALAGFATFACEHPHDCFPELVPSGTCFVASELGHPAIAAHRCVRNDVELDQQLRLLMVSGSNMSGKSTLLRTVGVNAVLALAGAPVRARALRLSPLAIGTAMRFRDSLEDGTSYFYAVLRRLRDVLELLDKPLPLLFLFDEILPGTNSHDRLVGAEAVIRRLLSGGAIGLATTHDLELTHVVEHLAPAAANIHFADTVEAGELHFDYRIRRGVVESSNALVLMRSLGLHV
jgi:hypothetical protein